ncbi:cell division protein FtsQ/DivIB [Edaphobacter albus]|uniref:cell division protein FtsQ/DivIB n=1 Tax=Edaphobacter sp. 4G125 TaxID=2763071 RepID=UPI00164580A9|nr:FtsQ-type POTRA domain-containing protein [Edaphobacter sp. 4G125]QNI38460.1 FtsQ-type POTRA domain-containing protein [Edaphobacter sp. 4G125]
MMAREFTDFEDEFDDEPLPRRQSGIRVKLRGGLPRSRGGKIALVAIVLVLIGLCGALAMTARTAILHDERFLIPSSTAIETTGNTNVTRAQLVAQFGEDIERNIFRVPLEQRKAQLEQLPWVQQATVMRLLPNRLRVAVVERTPIAFVRQGNRIGLVDANGILLDMPSNAQGAVHYSFPVVTGLVASDPLSLRAARMKLYTRFTGEMDGGGEKISEKLSEVDLSYPEDVRAVIPDKNGEVLVHFGEDNFLDRYRKFEDHLAEWRQQYPRLAAVDMRYDRQVVLEMQPGPSAPATTGGQRAPVAENKKAVAPAVPAAAPAKAPTPAHSGGAAASHAAPAKKTKAKPPVKGKKPVAKKGASAKAVRTSGESFWVHPKQQLTAVAGQSSNIHPAQAVHP